MTLAICIRCGAEKHGAFTQCDGCDFRPLTDEDLGKSLMMTDHYHRREDLQQIGAAVAGGSALRFRPEDLDLFVRQIRETGTRHMLGLPPEPPGKKPPGWKVYPSG